MQLTLRIPLYVASTKYIPLQRVMIPYPEGMIRHAKAVIYLGETDWRNQHQRFGIQLSDLMIGGMAIFGRTGTGKSALIERMVIEALHIDGLGVMVIDRHGDLASDLVALIPEARVKDTTYLAPHLFPVAWNPLQSFDPSVNHLIESGIVESFKKIWGESIKARAENVIRYSVLSLLLVSPNPTLADVERILIDGPFRKSVIARLRDEQALAFWKKFQDYTKYFRQQVTEPVLNKIGAVLANPLVKRTVASRRSRFSLREVIDSGRVLIADLSIGRLGSDASRLLGSLLLTQLEVAAVSRSDLPESQRRPFLVFVDEAHTMRLLDASQIRKYGLAMVVAGQRVDAFDPEDRDNILANVGTLVAFRLGPRDAELLEAELMPQFNQHDLVNLERYAIRLKLMISGVVSKPFSARTLPPPEEKTGVKDRIIEQSRRRYGLT